MITLTKEQAHRFLIAYHGLDGRSAFFGKNGILEYLRRVGCIQYDPLNVVGQNSELVLQARIEQFDRSMLQELLYSDYRLIDVWDKNMSISLVEDWPYFNRFRRRYRQWCVEHAEVVAQIRAAIRSKGTLCSGDFELNEKVGWYYGPTRLARAALEGMYYSGELIVHHKKNTRKYYDLAERHIAPEILAAAEPNPADADYLDWFVLRRIGSVGLLWNRPSDAWLGINGFIRDKRNAAFERLLKRGKIREVRVAELKDSLFLRSVDEPILAESLQKELPAPCAKILAPLDNMLWDRKLIRELFGFEYRWEVYKPVAERQYGYYVLPVLYGAELVARLEPEKHRRHEPFTIKNWWWEPGVAVTAEMRAALDDCLQSFAQYLGVDGCEMKCRVFE